MNIKVYISLLNISVSVCMCMHVLTLTHIHAYTCTHLCLLCVLLGSQKEHLPFSLPHAARGSI